MVVCTGCSCLCDDIVLQDGKILHTCRKGVKLFRAERNTPLIDSKPSDIEEALKAAGEIVSNSDNLVIYGLDTIPCEAQEKAIELAKEKGAAIDDCSSFCLGDLVELVLKGELPTATLDEVRDNAYVIVYWGANPHQSLPRHMSRFTYYPRSGKRQRGYEEDRYLVVVDVRLSETAKLARKGGKFIMGSDADVIDSFLKALDGKAGKHPEVAAIIKEMQRADFNVIFGGLGLKYGLGGDYSRFIEMVERLNEFTRVAFIPAGFHANMRGFNELMFRKTGVVNAYDFSSNERVAFSEAIMKADAALIIGSDPVKSLPWHVAKRLAEIDTILVDPSPSLTSRVAKVIIPTAISGIDQGGTMVRSDGVAVELQPFKEGLEDVSVISSLMEGV
ncbi:formylmethanofuran dehydrogenase subunit B [Archaeoglobus veneficus]|uniref:formylmethanofuran dehydrogenase subunit B n=1 Tax=Archaeoglobus veneficus (strain DSM 11195 / SNP6) TaxID=693661 RepID=F2KT90_ARCVS|nr:formylmethanofuran dehydrogenase subunit B [Archaeoglobus veneficus]AEA47120.1 formylmethanofuran dehydrogenase subunit B [Archaeoglobus veneficus SNP6]